MKLLDQIEQHEIDDQIKIRQELLSQMVGNLYPAIIRGEIRKLEERRREFITEKEMNV